MTKKVKIALVRRDASLAGIAREIGTSKGYLSMILSGDKPGATLRPRLAQLLGLTEAALAREIDRARQARRTHSATTHPGSPDQAAA